MLAGSVVLAGMGVAPAGAVQSDTFGISPAPGSPQSGGDHLEASARPGRSVDDQLLVWNRTAAALTLRLSVEPAHLGPRGVPSLGGPIAPTRWIHLGYTSVALPAHGTKLIPVTVAVPRVLPHLPAQAAVVATPVQTLTGRVSVVLQLAVLVSMNAAPGAASRAPLGTIGWVALALVLAAGLTWALLDVRQRSRRRRSTRG